MEGTNGIPETEIRAYFKNRGIVPEPWELRVLEIVDAIAVSEKGNKSQTDDEEED